MQFKELEWKDIISDGVIIKSDCIIKVYSYDIIIEFSIYHEKNENKYSLYSFGKGSLRRLQADIFDSIDEAKNAAYRIYNHEMLRMKNAIDSFLIEE